MGKFRCCRAPAFELPLDLFGHGLQLTQLAIGFGGIHRAGFAAQVYGE